VGSLIRVQGLSEGLQTGKWRPAPFFCMPLLLKTPIKCQQRFAIVPSRRQETSESNNQAFQMGEGNSFEFFFRQYYTPLSFFANSILHNEEEAKDIVQDCFVKLWDSQTINERSETVKSFLYTAVRNKCVDLLRKKKVIQKAKLQLTKNIESDFEYFDEVAFAEMMRQLDGYLAELPSKVQEIIKLYYIDKKKYHEIANEINSTSEAVRKQKERALKIIRQKFLFLCCLF